MKEYRVKVTVRNNLILKAIEETGAKSVAEFCRNNGLSNVCVGHLVAMRVKPILDSGEFSNLAKELMEVLGCCPTDLWTSEQLNLRLGKNSHEVFMNQQMLQAAICGEATPLQIELPDESLNKTEVSSLVNNLLEKHLTKRQQQVIKMRHYNDKDCSDVARSLTLSPSRIMQIESKAMRELRRFATKNKALKLEISEN